MKRLLRGGIFENRKSDAHLFLTFPVKTSRRTVTTQKCMGLGGDYVQMVYKDDYKYRPGFFDQVTSKSEQEGLKINNSVF